MEYAFFEWNIKSLNEILVFLNFSGFIDEKMSLKIKNTYRSCVRKKLSSKTQHSEKLGRWEYIKTTLKRCDKWLEQSKSEKRGNRVARSSSFPQTGTGNCKTTKSIKQFSYLKAQKFRKTNKHTQKVRLSIFRREHL